MAKRGDVILRLIERIPLPRLLHEVRLMHILSRQIRHGLAKDLISTYEPIPDASPDGMLRLPFLAEAFLAGPKESRERARSLISAEPAATRLAAYWASRARVFQGLGDSNAALEAYARMIRDCRPSRRLMREALMYAGRHAEAGISKEIFHQAANDASLRLLARFFNGDDPGIGPLLGGKELRQITPVAEGMAAGYGRIHRLGAAENIRIECFNEDGAVMASRMITSYLPYVAEIHDGCLSSGSSLIRVGDKTVLSDLLTDAQHGHQVSLDADPTVIAMSRGRVLLDKPPTARFLAEGVNLTGTFSHAYGHWFAEFLPKLRHHACRPGFAEVPLIVDEGMPESHYDFLKALVPNPFYALGKGQALRVGKLWDAPTVNFCPPQLLSGHDVPPEEQAACSVDALNFLSARLRLPRTAPQGKGTRLFLSRRNSRWRRLINEAEVEQALSSMGFKTTYLEDQTFAEQRRILADADIVVAPNGSAAVNLIFADPSVRTVLLTQRRLHNLGGWLGPMRDLGYHIDLAIGDAVQAGAGKHSDYFIPPAEVISKVRNLL